MKHFTLLSFSLFLTATLLAVIDRTVLRNIANQHEIPRFERQVTTTPEFHYTADINSNGYRNDEFGNSLPTGEVRIVTIGDSFTYGWGVEEADSWPRILEENLRATGHRVRVLNLGKPGDTPLSYARTAARMLPKLTPHLVIVAILQGDDVAQLNTTTPADVEALSTHMQAANDEAATPSSHKAKVLRLFKALYPNAARLRTLRSRTQTVSIATIWQKQVRGILNSATSEELDRYNTLPGEVQALYETGGLNPSLLRLAINRPDYFSGTWDISTPYTHSAIDTLSACIASIGKTCRQLGAMPYIISIPYGMYSSSNDWTKWKNVGFELSPEMLTQDNADTLIAGATQRAGLAFHSVLHAFRTQAQSADLFYTFDGHFNPAGHRIFARLLTEQIVPHVKTLEQQLNTPQ